MSGFRIRLNRDRALRNGLGNTDFFLGLAHPDSHHSLQSLSYRNQ